jgi:hypothetical protein
VGVRAAKRISHCGQKSILVKGLEEKSESASLPDSGLSGMIFTASDKDNASLG